MLKNNIIIVTGGAGSGIGHGLSIALAEHHATVLIIEKDVLLMNKLVKKLRSKGRKAEGYECDIANGAQVNSTVKAILKKHKRVDGLVNSAGVGLIRPPAKCTDEEYNRIMSIDLYGTFALCRAVIPSMIRQKRGSIVNISSIHGARTCANYGVYAAAKSGVEGLTRGLAAHYGANGIRVNAIQPGLVDGAQTRRIVAQFTKNVPKFMHDFTHNRQCLDHLIQPREIGEAAAFLLSDRSQSITGATIPVDAGLLTLITSKN